MSSFGGVMETVNSRLAVVAGALLLTLACGSRTASSRGGAGGVDSDAIAGTGGDIDVGTGGSAAPVAGSHQGGAGSGGTKAAGGMTAAGGSEPTGGAMTGTGGASATAGAGGSAGSAPTTTGAFKMLVYHETRAYVRNSIQAGIDMLRALGQDNDFTIVESDGDRPNVHNDPQITTEDLAPFDIVVFLNTSGDVFGPASSPERDVFRDYIREKRAFVGIGGAADTEYNFPWYEDLVGEIFDGHVKEYPAPAGSITIEPSQQNHPAMAGLPTPWTRHERWFIFDDRIDGNLPGVNILMRYGGGESTSGPELGQPLAWTRCWEGARSFYTSLGQEALTFDEPLVRQHILGGVLWAVRRLHAPGETCP